MSCAQVGKHWRRGSSRIICWTRRRWRSGCACVPQEALPPAGPPPPSHALSELCCCSVLVLLVCSPLANRSSVTHSQLIAWVKISKCFVPWRSYVSEPALETLVDLRAQFARMLADGGLLPRGAAQPGGWDDPAAPWNRHASRPAVVSTATRPAFED